MKDKLYNVILMLQVVYIIAISINIYDRYQVSKKAASRIQKAVHESDSLITVLNSLKIDTHMYSVVMTFANEEANKTTVWTLNSIVWARNEEEATGKAYEGVKEDYLGFNLQSTMVTNIPDSLVIKY